MTDWRSALALTVVPAAARLQKLARRPHTSNHAGPKARLCLGHEIAVAGICPRQQEIDARVCWPRVARVRVILLPDDRFQVVGNASKKSASCFRAGMPAAPVRSRWGWIEEETLCVKARRRVKRNTESTSPAREKPKPRIWSPEETFLPE